MKEQKMVIIVWLQKDKTGTTTKTEHIGDDLEYVLEEKYREKLIRDLREKH